MDIVFSSIQKTKLQMCRIFFFFADPISIYKKLLTIANKPIDIKLVYYDFLADTDYVFIRHGYKLSKLFYCY